MGLFLSTRGSTHTRRTIDHRPPIPFSVHQLLHTDAMSHNPVSTASGSSSNFRSIFDAALKNYEEKTKKNLLAHQLTVQLQNCNSPSAILDILNRQYNVQQFIQSQSDGQRSKQWLNATVTVLCEFSAALGQGLGIVNPQNLSCQGYATNIQTRGVLTIKGDLCRNRCLPHGTQIP